ncbi:MAG: DNA glycosylase [Bacillota bacterium]
MIYQIEGNKIIITEIEDFNPQHILDCGQVFRYQQINSGYKIFSQNLFCSLIYDKDRVIIETTDINYFVTYFDLDRDYGAIKQHLLGYQKMRAPIEHGSGIRILNQDKAEMIISFIISANNNIPRIKTIIERLCSAIGQDMGDYRAFPTVEALAQQDEAFYRSIGAGYRANYLVSTARALREGFNLNCEAMSYTEARKHLMKLKGIGGKVADCILLFGYHRQDACPTDVWIERAFIYLFGETTITREAMSKKLSEHFGGLGGYAQQYLFYYIREKNNQKISKVEE